MGIFLKGVILVFITWFLQPWKILGKPLNLKIKIQALETIEFEPLPWKSPGKLVTLDFIFLKILVIFLLLQLKIFTLNRVPTWFGCP